MFRSETICVAYKRVIIQKFKVGIEIELSQADLNLATVVRSTYIYLHLRQNKTAQLVGDLGPLKSYGFHLIGKEQIHLEKILDINDHCYVEFCVPLFFKSW